MAHNKEYAKKYNKLYWNRVKSNPELKAKIQVSRRNASRKWAANNEEKIKLYQANYSKSLIKNRRLRLRFEILTKHKFKCVYCGRGAGESILQIDHIVPRAKGGKNEVNNLTVACKECNTGKSDILINY